MSDPDLSLEFAGLEFHDSCVEAIETDTAGTVLVRFEYVYIHRSAGVPGVAPGTVWTQPAVIRISAGIVEGVFSELPAYVYDGDLHTPQKHFSNMLPLPASVCGPTSLILKSGGEQVTITGGDMTVELLDEAEFLEEFQ